MEYKKQLQELLRTHSAQGEFATGGIWSEVPAIPGIVVNGMGNLGLPLSDAVAAEIIKVNPREFLFQYLLRYYQLKPMMTCVDVPPCQHSERAPFGKGGETLVDETVRKTFQIDGDKISFANPAWHAALKDLVAKCATSMNCGDGVEAHLYKLLLYEQGGFFKPHRDTEKEPGMFGTLVSTHVS